jgi:hypothetical protein
MNKGLKLMEYKHEYLLTLYKVGVSYPFDGFYKYIFIKMFIKDIHTHIDLYLGISTYN